MGGDCLHSSGSINRERSAIWCARRYRSAAIGCIIYGAVRSSTTDGDFRGGIVVGYHRFSTSCRCKFLGTCYRGDKCIKHAHCLYRPVSGYGDWTATGSTCASTCVRCGAAISGIADCRECSGRGGDGEGVVSFVYIADYRCQQY